MKDDKRCLLIIDDEKRIRRAVKDFLAASGFYILEAADGEEGYEVFYQNIADIDLILLDVMMPGQDGFTLLKKIRETSIVPVIMLTAKGEAYDQIRGFQCGADDYIAKPFVPSLLLLRLEAILKRVGKDVSQELQIGNICINLQRRLVKIDGETLEMTRREYDLLTYFIMNRGITLTREQLLNGVWGYDYEGDFRTVDTHVKQLRIKLGSYAEYIKTIFRIGYCFEVKN